MSGCPFASAAELFEALDRLLFQLQVQAIRADLADAKKPDSPGYGLSDLLKGSGNEKLRRAVSEADKRGEPLWDEEQCKLWGPAQRADVKLAEWLAEETGQDPRHFHGNAWQDAQYRQARAALARLGIEARDRLWQKLQSAFPEVAAALVKRAPKPAAGANAPSVSADRQATHPERRPPVLGNVQETTIMAVASLWTGGTIDDRIRQIAQIVEGKGTVQEKLAAMHKVLPIPHWVCAQKLAALLGCKSSSSVKKTKWWKEQRWGKKAEVADQREKKLKTKGRNWEDQPDDD